MNHPRSVAPSVSVIVPTLNAERHLGETLESVQRQTLTTWECLVVDDRSDDGSPSIVESFASADHRFRLLRREVYSPKGVSSCRNIGLQASSGVCVQFLDADDLLAPTALSTKYDVLERANCDAAICGHTAFCVMPDGAMSQGKSYSVVSTDPLADHLSGLLCYFVSGPLWRRDYLIRNNLFFDTSFCNMEDLDFNVRALFVTHARIELIDQPLVLYRRHPHSSSSRQSSFSREHVRSAYHVRARLLGMLSSLRGTDVVFASLSLASGFCHGAMMASGARDSLYAYKNIRSYAECAPHKYRSIVALVFAAVVFGTMRKGTRLFAALAPVNNGYYSAPRADHE